MMASRTALGEWEEKMMVEVMVVVVVVVVSCLLVLVVSEGQRMERLVMRYNPSICPSVKLGLGIRLAEHRRDQLPHRTSMI